MLIIFSFRNRFRSRPMTAQIHFSTFIIWGWMWNVAIIICRMWLPVLTKNQIPQTYSRHACIISVCLYNRKTSIKKTWWICTSRRMRKKNIQYKCIWTRYPRVRSKHYFAKSRIGEPALQDRKLRKGPLAFCVHQIQLVSALWNSGTVKSMHLRWGVERELSASSWYCCFRCQTLSMSTPTVVLAGSRSLRNDRNFLRLFRILTECAFPRNATVYAIDWSSSNVARCIFAFRLVTSVRANFYPLSLSRCSAQETFSVGV